MTVVKTKVDLGQFFKQRVIVYLLRVQGILNGLVYEKKRSSSFHCL